MERKEVSEVTVDNIIAGLEILKTTSKSPFCVSASHDVIYAGGDQHVTDEQRAKLLELGWWFSHEVDSWGAFT